MPSSSPSIAGVPEGTRVSASPASLVILIALVAFLVEVLEPIVFGLLPPLPERAEILVDAMLMTSVLSAFLYLFLMRPMMQQIRWREHAEDQLRTINQRLEVLVEERTAELLGANRRLSTAIDEQRSTAESLRRTTVFVESVFNKTACLLLAFDATTRRPIYVNSRVAEMLGYDQDEIVAASDDLAVLLIAPKDRASFLEHIAELAVDPSGHPARESLDFLTADGKRIGLIAGLTVLEETPGGQAKTLLLTAMPADT